MYDELVYAFFINKVTKTYGEAMRFIDVSFYKEAIKSELDSMVSNQTWKLVEPPKDFKPISSKCNYKKKLRPDDSIDKQKAILVIRTFNQKKRVDYIDTYSLMTKIATIRILVAFVAIHSLTVHQMDMKTTFFNVDLEEEIYISQPKGCTVPTQENKVCKLRNPFMALSKSLNSGITNLIAQQYKMILLQTPLILMCIHR